jgi:hypothetical protein
VEHGPARSGGREVVLLAEECAGRGQNALFGGAGAALGERRGDLQVGADVPGPLFGDGIGEVGEGSLLVGLVAGQPCPCLLKDHAGALDGCVACTTFWPAPPSATR